MLLVNSNISQSLELEIASIDKMSNKPLSHKKRTFRGKVYVNRFGYDMEYSVKARISSREDLDKLISFGEDNVEISGQDGLEDGEYYIGKIKVAKFSLINDWYHVSMKLTKYYVKG